MAIRKHFFKPLIVTCFHSYSSIRSGNLQLKTTNGLIAWYNQITLATLFMPLDGVLSCYIIQLLPNSAANISRLYGKRYPPMYAQHCCCPALSSLSNSVAN